MRPARLRCCIREGVCDSLFGHYAVKLNSLNLLWYGDHSTQAIHQDGQTVGHYHRLNAAWGICSGRNVDYRAAGGLTHPPSDTPPRAR